jgi:DNA polymerase-1
VSKRILLIDADVIAYEACSACQQELEYEPGYYTWVSSLKDVQDTFDTTIATIKSALQGDRVVLCLTDSEGNFRKTILPTYKGKRGKKPLVLKRFKEALVDQGAVWRSGLEGDDCMGILATRSNPDGDERIIVSIDKDMKQIPGKLVRWPNTDIVEVTEEEADYFHMLQTLTGDVTDGYSGCPGVGPVKAEKVLKEALNEWHQADFANGFPETKGIYVWEHVVRAYHKAGLSEQDALVQARVARILRASDYDFKRREVKLWTP